MRKIEAAAVRLQSFKDLFQCPLCRESMETDLLSFVCARGHRFDLSKNGYLNLLPHADQSIYSKDLFSARAKVCRAGFFDPLLDRITEEILCRRPDAQGLRILDAGCGEGSHLIRILQRLERQWDSSDDSAAFGSPVAVGIDISKEGIRQAAARTSGIIWCVADLASLPLKSEQFDVVLNILSPANYDEFNRVLKKNGILIKLVPEKDYLQEIRRAVFESSERLPYLNDPVVQGFYARMKNCSQQRLAYQIFPDRDFLEDILKMTPMTMDQDIEKVRDHIFNGQNTVTAAFRILTGEKGAF
jgi:23S rRNA (guanine745-N1)-methyltransferase